MNKVKLLVLSPHADDAVFSAFDHMMYWAKNRYDITICTIFSTFASNILSRDAETYMKLSGCMNVFELQRLRMKEDAEALAYMHVKYISPNLTDGLFRSNNQTAFYTNYSDLFGDIISKFDTKTRKILSTYLQQIERRYDYIVTPLGIGNHVDHRLTTLCSSSVIDAAKLLYYCDMPYAFHIRNWKKQLSEKIDNHKVSIKFTSTRKKICMEYYRSQKSLLIRNERVFFFSNRFMFFPEIIYYPIAWSNK